MGLSERVIVILFSVFVAGTSVMIFSLGLFFLNNRRRLEEFFLKPYREQMQSLSLFRNVPIFGMFYYRAGSWYTRTFPESMTDDMHNDYGGRPYWLNSQTVNYFVLLITGVLLVYGIITILVSIGSVYAMVVL